MPESNFSHNNLEAEIAELAKQIEQRKRVLEQQHGIIPEGKELVVEAIAEHFGSRPPAAPAISNNDQTTPSASAARSTEPGRSYLDALDPDTVLAVNSYVSMIQTKGIKNTVAQVRAEAPFIIDAFHDVLVTHFYEELKARGIVK